MTPGALSVLDAAIAEHQPSHVFALFSGGHDSLTATAIAAEHPRFTAAVHINTGIGIEETREFVRETCRREGWPLLELHPDGKTYEDLVLAHGFPGGPRSHNTMYYWLKQRQVRRLVREHKRGRHDRIGLVTGIRASESQRRMASVMAQPSHRVGAQAWINPILDWSALDCSRFIGARGLERNRVVDLLHRSGECLCGALAHANEIGEIARWFPEEAARIHALEHEVAVRCLAAQRWGGRLGRVSNSQMALPLCSSCASREDAA